MESCVFVADGKSFESGENSKSVEKCIDFQRKNKIDDCQIVASKFLG